MRTIGIKNVCALNKDNWFDIVEPLLQHQLEYHRQLDIPDEESFSESFYDARKDYENMEENNSAFACFVAYNGNEPIGFAAGYIEENDAVPYRIGHIVGLFLEEDWRGLNIGESLLSTLTDWMLDSTNVRYVLLEVLFGNEKVLDFYFKHGYQPYSYVLIADKDSSKAFWK